VGATIAIGSGRRAALFGGLIMGSTLFLHEQLLVPLIVVAFALFVRDRRSRRDLAIGVSVTGGLAALLVLSTLGTNPRVSGADGASFGHVLDNLPYITGQLRRSTPFGDFFWSTGGFDFPRVAIFVILGAAIALTWVLTRTQSESSSTVNPFAAMGLAAVAWLGSVLPIIAPGIPWHTPRVMYIPAIAMAFFLGGLTEAISQHVAHPIATGFLVALVVGWAVWGAMALGTEAESLRNQLTLTDQRLNSLVSAVDRSQGFTDSSLLVIAGYPGWDQERPVFGEHIVGITRPDIQTRLGFRLYEPPATPSFDIRPGWEGLCLGGDGRLELLDEYVESRALEVPVDGASYAVWVDGAWSTQIGQDPLAPSESLIGMVPPCVGQ
jgi:hypothetical protein